MDDEFYSDRLEMVQSQNGKLLKKNLASRSRNRQGSLWNLKIKIMDDEFYSDHLKMIESWNGPLFLNILS